MSSVDNRRDKSISDFFSKAGAGTTRSECDAYARQTFGGPIEPVSPQGTFSYTVTAANNTLIVQFRDNGSPLDTDLLETVRKTHPGFTAGCRFHGTIGSSPPLLIYAMDKIAGDTYLNISLCLDDDSLDQQLATVRSLARFFAQSWENRSRLDRDAISAISKDCHSRFKYLSSNLPARFQEPITRVQEKLPALLSGEYPLVLTHGDLSEENILANPETGEITGIVDWAEASIQPFGFSLYALDNILGYQDLKQGWVFHSTAELLRDEFWKKFSEQVVGGVSQADMELIRLARLAGLFLRYGLQNTPGREGEFRLGGDTSMQILGALVQG